MINCRSSVWQPLELSLKAKLWRLIVEIISNSYLLRCSPFPSSLCFLPICTLLAHTHTSERERDFIYL